MPHRPRSSFYFKLSKECVFAVSYEVEKSAKINQRQEKLNVSPKLMKSSQK